MERIIKLIEDKMASDECTIYLLKRDTEELKHKLAEAEKTIEEQAHIISDLKGKKA
jgi:hypothetical protein